MNSSDFSQAYANDLIFELEKAFWDERGKGARFRVTNVGHTYFQSACAPRLQSTEVGDMVQAIESALQQDGIVRRISAERDGQLLRVRVEGCLHRPVEDQLVANNTRPFTCVPANLIVMAVEEKLDRPAELAEIKLEDGACQLLVVLFDKRPFLE
jgi:hypothetical protein